ncbi:MAG: BspA family leucine-rich repeat surface protein [Oscillospiraceae bacterium]|nr:BspA family leucine-rich repeat surface protein [Oscillospiraceae bacterium]
MAQDILQNVWSEWTVTKEIGRGSFGTVYEAVRSDHGVQSKAAVKVITIPSDKSEVDSLRSEGMTADGTRTYFMNIVNDFVSEVQLMETFKGMQNIVSVEDYRVMEKKDSVGWDIFIRMELLTPFNTYIQGKKMTEKEVIKLGVDICTALEICAQRNIIHRDIKPENIFINDFGYFKLGDFGIARKLENVTGGLSQKGTYNYMAPEIATGRYYDATVDIYSLGIVLYRLLNDNRLPFITEEQMFNPNERQKAVDRRFHGEPLPVPKNASPAMTDVILRACAHNPKDRYATATEFKNALLEVEKSCEASLLDIDSKAAEVADTAPSDINTDNTPVPETVVEADDKTELIDKTGLVEPVPLPKVINNAPKKRKKKPVVIAAVCVCLVAVIIVGIALVASGGLSICTAYLDNDCIRNPVFDKTEITEIVFLDSLSTYPSGAWDFSTNKDYSVIGWLDGTCLYVAGDGGVIAGKDMSNMFSGYTSLTSISFKGFDTSNATNMSGLFENCSSLTSLSLDSPSSKGFVTSKVTDMSSMFYNCSSLTSLSLSSMNTSKVVNMSNMFNNCSSLTSLYISKFNTSKVTDMSYMFCGCSSLTSLYVSYDTSSVTNMNSMFRYCSSLTSLSVSSFDTSNVTDMSYMFADCSSLESLNVSNFSFNSSAVTDMKYMFYNCSSLTTLTMFEYNTYSDNTKNMFKGTIFE